MKDFIGKHCGVLAILAFALFVLVIIFTGCEKQSIAYVSSLEYRIVLLEENIRLKDEMIATLKHHVELRNTTIQEYVAMIEEIIK